MYIGQGIDGGASMTGARQMNRKLTAVLAAAAISGMAAPVAATPAAAAALPQVAFTAQAFGTQLTAGGVVRSGPSALSSIGCTTVAPKGTSGSIASATLPVAGSTGAVTTSARSAQTLTSRSSTSTSRVAGVNLLGGLVRADALSTTSTASVDTASKYTGRNAAVLSNLVISGRRVSASTGPNTRIRFGQVGKVPFATAIVNKQERVTSNGELRVATAAVTVLIDSSNPLGLPVGSRIDVAQSKAYLSAPLRGLVGGKGYATSVTALDGRVLSSPTALVYPRCSTGDAASSVAHVSVPGLLTSGTTQTTTRSATSSSSRSVTVKNAIASPNVLLGVITASAVTADTSVAQSGVLAPTARDSSRFVGLKVAGFPTISDTVRPNTVVTIPSLGTVTFHKVTRTSSSLEVIMLEVVLNRAVGGLPTGSVVRIGYSNSKLA
ncbi:choice-of-anchor P family protein [Terrabacter sp. AAH1]